MAQNLIITFIGTKKEIGFPFASQVIPILFTAFLFVLLKFSLILRKPLYFMYVLLQWPDISLKTDNNIVQFVVRSLWMLKLFLRFD